MASTTTPPFTLSLPGYGVLFFHQLGQLAHLRDRGAFATTATTTQCRRLHLLGSSAGALAAALIAADVCPDRAARAAHALCERAGLYGSSSGASSIPASLLLSRLRPFAALAGKWGALVRGWLAELLPEDAHERVHQRCVVVAVVRVLGGGGGGSSGGTWWASAKAAARSLAHTLHLRDFRSRDDLIDALAASAHVPLFMDARPVASTRWGWLVDGSLLHLLLGPRRGGLVPGSSSSSHRVVVLDPFDDPHLRAAGWGWLHCLRLPTLAAALGLVEMGRRHAAELERRGAFDGLLTPASAVGKVMAAKEEEEDLEGVVTVLAGLSSGGGSSNSLAAASTEAAAACDDDDDNE